VAVGEGQNCFQVISWPKKQFLGSPSVLSPGLPQGCSISNLGLARIGKPFIILNSTNNNQHVTTIKSKREKTANEQINLRPPTIDEVPIVVDSSIHIKLV